MCMAIDAAIYLTNKIIDLKVIDPKYQVDYFKLHKLLYFAQGVMLAKYNKTMFNESIRAHRCGPAVDGLYPLYLKVGENEINNKISLDSPIDLTENRKQVLDFIAKEYGKQGRDSIIFATKEQEPYKTTWEEYTSNHATTDTFGNPEGFDENFGSIYDVDCTFYSIIPIELIRMYFLNSFTEVKDFIKEDNNAQQTPKTI